MAPQVPCDQVHVAPPPAKLRLRFLKDLLGGQPRIEFQLQFLGEFLLPQPPVALGSRQQIVFQELLVFLQIATTGLAAGPSSLSCGVSPASSKRPCS